MVLLASCGVVPSLASPLAAQEPSVSLDPSEADEARGPYLFHRPELGYGSASSWGPLGLLANRGLSNLVLQNRDRDLTRMEWGLGFDAVTDALLNPGAAIERSGGWGAFLRREFWAEDGRVWRWAWAPNYGGHIVAGGISYRQLSEWFDAEGVRYPKAVAALCSSWG